MLTADALPAEIARLADQSVIEALPEGRVDKTRRIWQKPGRGSAVGGKAFAGDIDPRHLRFAAETLYGKRRLRVDMCSSTTSLLRLRRTR